MTDLNKLAERVDAGERSNVLDVSIEIALFEPCKAWASVRSNNAGTKVIYTTPDGDDCTFRPLDWTMAKNRKATAAALRAEATEADDVSGT